MNNLVSRVLPNIGGDFEINFDDKQIFNKLKRSYKPNYNKKYIYYTHCGRSAISLAITILKKKNNNLKALLPLYCCKSVIQPFKENGINLNSENYDTFIHELSNNENIKLEIILLRDKQC